MPYEFLGPDWKWGNQDGGAGNIGRVFSVANGVAKVIKVLADHESRLRPPSAFGFSSPNQLNKLLHGY